LLPTSDKKGRVAAFEILVGTSGIRNLIRENKSFQVPSMIQTGGSLGMTTMDMSLIRLYKNDKITKETAIQSAVDEMSVRKSVGG
jgi:twitching motility protein PilT